jgi:hypothetical protein
MPGYTAEEITYWWVAIGVGTLVSLVKNIDRGVVNVRDTLRAITGNTANTPLIPETAERVDAVLAEGLNHHLFLTRTFTNSAGAPRKVDV